MDLLYTVLNTLAGLPLLLQIALAPVLLLAFHLTVAVLWISWSFVLAVLTGDI